MVEEFSNNLKVCNIGEKEDWKVEKIGKYSVVSLKRQLMSYENGMREKDKARYKIIKEYVEKNGIE